MTVQRAKLPVFATVGAAYGSVGNNFGSFLIVVAGVALWIAAGALVSVGVLLWLKDSETDAGAWFRGLTNARQTLVALVAPLLAALYSFAAMAVAWHRLIILGETPRLLLLNIWRRAFAYGWRVFLILMFFVVVTFMATWFAPARLVAQGGSSPALAYVGPAIFVCVLVGAWLVTVRWSLVLPGTALNLEPWSFSRSWLVTWGNTWRLAIGLFISQLPFNILNRVIEVGTAPEDGGESLIAALASILVGAVGAVVGVGFVSHAYLHFVGPAQKADA